MHPEIEAFWKKLGYHMYGPTIIGSWEIHIGDWIRRIETIYHGGRYRFEKKWYSEKEMLKIVKMKAFA